MRAYRFFTAIFFSALFMLSAAGVAHAADAKTQKVVYHMNNGDLKAAAAGLKNIQNHIEAVGEMNVTIAAVFHGDGVAALTAAPAKPEDKQIVETIQARITELKAKGVKFQVCANTLKAKKIDHKKDLFNVADGDIVKSGVAQIAILQSEGYAYIKP